MIHLVKGIETRRHAVWIDEMHRLRARVFKDRLGWEVEVSEGRERDRFDDENPLYILSIDDGGIVRGCLRLLQTTGPNMLRDVFPILLGSETVEHPTIWESSRFAIDIEPTGTARGGKVNRVTAELLCGLIEVGLKVGLTFVVSVFDARMLRVLRSAGYPADIIGAPRRIGGVQCYAGLFDVSEQAWRTVAAANGITGSVISAQSDAPCEAA